MLDFDPSFVPSLTGILITKPAPRPKPSRTTSQGVPEPNDPDPESDLPLGSEAAASAPVQAASEPDSAASGDESAGSSPVASSRRRSSSSITSLDSDPDSETVGSLAKTQEAGETMASTAALPPSMEGQRRPSGSNGAFLSTNASIGGPSSSTSSSSRSLSPTPVPLPPSQTSPQQPRQRTMSKHALEAARLVQLGFGRPEEGGVKGRVASYEEQEKKRRSLSGSSMGSVSDVGGARRPSRSGSIVEVSPPGSFKVLSTTAEEGPEGIAAVAPIPEVPTPTHQADGTTTPPNRVLTPPRIIEPTPQRSAPEPPPINTSNLSASTTATDAIPSSTTDLADVDSPATPPSAPFATAASSPILSAPPDLPSGVPSPAPERRADEEAVEDIEDGEIVEDPTDAGEGMAEAQEPMSPRRAQMGLEAIPEASPEAQRNSPLPLASAANDAPTPSTSVSLPPASSSSSSPMPTFPPPTQDSPLTLLVSRLPLLPITEQKSLARTLQTISTFPSSASKSLPLHQSWTLFFSDTSTTATKSTRRESGLKGADQYQSGMTEVFTVSDVPSLCGGLKALKQAVAKAVREGSMGASGGRDWVKKKGAGGAGGEDPTSVENPGMGLGLLSCKPGQNLHWFRKGVRPVWEDPWNAKGGRITITPPLAMLDQTYESMVLLVAGGVLDIDSSHPSPSPSTSSPPPPDFIPGTIVGVVGSRRVRGDRVELWIAGKDAKTPPEEGWIRRVQEVVAAEVGTADAKATRYKKHL